MTLPSPESIGLKTITAIMGKKLGILVTLIVIECFCSCSQKDEPAPTPTPTTVSVTAITLNPTSLTLKEGETGTITATVSPSNADNKKVIWSSSDASVATVSDGIVAGKSKGTAIITATADDNGKTAQCSVTVNAKSDGGGNTDPGNSLTAVDLGLSVKWANFNLGANAIEGYGDYYAWGETETKKSYTWSNYKWCNGSEKNLTKYNTNKDYGTVDNKGVLLAEDDAAHIKLGGEWRIPTKAEWDELYNECTWTWTTHNLVQGFVITAKNGNSIFLPASGTWFDTGLSYVGTYLYYCSSSLCQSEPSSFWTLTKDLYEISLSRIYGVPIRPVFGVATLTGDISISVRVLTSSDCTVSISTNSADTYYVGLIEKSAWDEYGSVYVCDFYIQDDKKDGVLSQYLYSGNRSFDLHDLTAKTEYVVFVTFCNSSGKRSGEIYSKSFTML